MKRFVIVIIMLTGILGAGCFSLFRLKNIVDQMETELSSLSELVEQKQGQDLQQKIQDFQRLWEDENHAELAAEISRLRHLIKHIYESELPTLQSVF